MERKVKKRVWMKKGKSFNRGTTWHAEKTG